MLDQRGHLLRAAIGFAECSPFYDRALWTLRTWLDSWSGIEHIAVSMYRATMCNSVSTMSSFACKSVLQRASPPERSR